MVSAFLRGQSLFTMCRLNLKVKILGEMMVTLLGGGLLFMGTWGFRGVWKGGLMGKRRDQSSFVFNPSCKL